MNATRIRNLIALDVRRRDEAIAEMNSAERLELVRQLTFSVGIRAKSARIKQNDIDTVGDKLDEIVELSVIMRQLLDAEVAA